MLQREWQNATSTTGTSTSEATVSPSFAGRNEKVTACSAWNFSGAARSAHTTRRSTAAPKSEGTSRRARRGGQCLNPEYHRDRSQSAGPQRKTAPLVHVLMIQAWVSPSGIRGALVGSGPSSRARRSLAMDGADEKAGSRTNRCASGRRAAQSLSMVRSRVGSCTHWSNQVTRPSPVPATQPPVSSESRWPVV